MFTRSPTSNASPINHPPACSGKTAKRAIGAATLLTVSLLVMTGTASAAQAPAHTGPAATSARHPLLALLPSEVTPVRPPRATSPAPRFVQQALPGHTLSCYRSSTGIQSLANKQWVSAEISYWGNGYGMLRARASSPSEWEQFTFCLDTTTYYWVIYAHANNTFVSTELSYTGGDYAMLRASATQVGPSEEYGFFCVAKGITAIQSMANHLWVSTELGYWLSSYAMLRARAYGVGPWEQYNIPVLGC